MSYYPKDVDWLRNEKVSYLRDTFGAGAVLLLEAMWCRMYDDGGPIALTLPVKAALSKESTVPLDEIEKIVLFCVDTEIALLEMSNDRYFAEGVRERISAVKKERTRKGGRNSGETPEESAETPEEPRRNSGTLSLSFPICNLDLEEGGTGEETKTPPPSPEPVKVPRGKHVSLTDDEISGVAAFYERKNLTEADMLRGIELLDAQLAKPKYSKENRDHAICLKGWVYRAVVEEKTSEERLKWSRGERKKTGTDWDKLAAEAEAREAAEANQ